jgi:L-asparaginase
MNATAAINRETHVIGKIDQIEAFNKDSSNVIKEDWLALIEAIYNNYDNYDAFVITHGTNTLSYTAAALSFALGNLAKPVIMTGSQVSYGYPGSDAPMNLENALRIAAYAKQSVAGVMVVFGSWIITGKREKKITEFDYDAFKAFNAGAIGRIGNSIRITPQNLTLHMNSLGARPAKLRDELDVQNNFDMRVASLTEFPGMDSNFLKALVTSEAYPIKGVILRAYGAGDPNVASPEATFHNLREGFAFLMDQQIPIVVTTQAPDGRACMDMNAPGKWAYNLGAIPASDMSIESMTVKLAWLLGSNTPYGLIRKQMTMPYKGEISSNSKQ